MLTGEFRASYAFVFEPQMPPGGGEAKYQITMLFPKTDVASYNAIMAEISKTLQEGVQKVFQGQMPARPRIPLQDGDGAKENGEPFGAECKGQWVLRASSKTRPSVVDLNIQPIIDPNAFYSGCYARATLNFYAYNQNGNKGVGCSLNNVQKVADGESLAGRSTAEEDFGGTNMWNGAATYGVPVQPAPAYPPTTSGYPIQPPQPPVPTYQAPVQSYPQYAPYQPPVQNPMQQGYQQPMVIDPITGLPKPPGGVMGI